MSDLLILKILEDKEKYDLYKDLVKDNLVTLEVIKILKGIGKYFEAFKEDRVNWDTFSTWYITSTMDGSKNPEVYKNIFSSLATMDGITDENPILQSFIRRSFALSISDEALKVSELESDSLDEVGRLYEEYLKISKTDLTKDESVILDDLTTIIESIDSGGGLSWRLPCLNESIGHIRRSNFIIVSALPETGKTTFCVSEVGFMAKQLAEGQYAVWFNNEEDGRFIKLRCIHSVLGITKDELLRTPKRYYEKYKEIMKDEHKIIIYDSSNIHYRSVEKFLEKYNPGLIVFDQLRKVSGFKNKSESEQITDTFGWARSISKKYCPVIAVHQASGDAIGQKWIDIGSLYYSRIGVQGEADVIIMIADPKETDGQRNINIVKNKLTGKHDKHTVIIVPDVGRYKPCYKP